jgi:predicted O-methyltransferase YrrM
MKLAPNTFQGLHGDEVALFQKVLKGVSGIGVEIGCCDGFSSAVILEASELHLTSIDPFIPDSMEPSLIGSKERYLENVAPWGIRTELFEGYSEDAVPHVHFDMPLDFLFIDGDHQYEAVLDDFLSWEIRIRSGGLLAMHDARMGREGGAPFHPGPSRVAQEEVFGQPNRWEVIGEAFSLVIARKL